MTKTSLLMHPGMLKEAVWRRTLFPLPTRMVVLMHCSRRPTEWATLMSMTLCVAHESTSMRMLALFITPPVTWLRRLGP
jgi:hypothetical protein